MSINAVIGNVKSNRDAWPFYEAVDGNKFPMYYQVITNPIDLSIIGKKIEKREYEKFEEIENDFKLMVNNCETFNGPKNGFTLMAYGVWRAFKRASLKHLRQELTHSESTAFIYPPKVANTNLKPAIEAKKKKMRNKRRSTFKALNVLAKAAEKAVEANERRSTLSNCSSVGDSSPYSNLSCDSMASNATTESTRTQKGVKVHGDMLANFLFNANNEKSDQNQHLVYTNTLNTTANPLPNENLTFKSLDEWSKSIKQSGNYVVLPQHAVILSSPQFTQCTNGPVVRPQISLKVVSSGNATQSSSIVTGNGATGPTSFTSSIISNNENASQELINSNPKRLVIKLSRCESQVWRPVTLITSSAQNTGGTTAIHSNGQSLTINGQQFQGFRTIPSNCVPVKKRFVISEATPREKPSYTVSTANISNNNSQSFQLTGIENLEFLKSLIDCFFKQRVAKTPEFKCESITSAEVRPELLCQ